MREGFRDAAERPSVSTRAVQVYNRKFVVITYRTDPDALRQVVPEPLEPTGDTVAYEFIRMPDSTGFGDYTESGQVIPVRFRAKDGSVQEGGYVHAMYLDDNAPISGGREIWGFPRKLASPKIKHERETVVCTLHYGSVLCASATMGYKHRELDPAPRTEEPCPAELRDEDHPARRLHAAALRAGALLLGRRHAEGRVVRPCGHLEHAMCDVARLPVHSVIAASHYITDLTLGLGEVVFDYLYATPDARAVQDRQPT